MQSTAMISAEDHNTETKRSRKGWAVHLLIQRLCPERNKQKRQEWSKQGATGRLTSVGRDFFASKRTDLTHYNSLGASFNTKYWMQNMTFWVILVHISELSLKWQYCKSDLCLNEGLINPTMLTLWLERALETCSWCKTLLQMLT